MVWQLGIRWYLPSRSSKYHSATQYLYFRITCETFVKFYNCLQISYTIHADAAAAVQVKIYHWCGLQASCSKSLVIRMRMHTCWTALLFVKWLLQSGEMSLNADKLNKITKVRWTLWCCDAFVLKMTWYMVGSQWCCCSAEVMCNHLSMPRMAFCTRWTATSW